MTEREVSVIVPSVEFWEESLFYKPFNRIVADGYEWSEGLPDLEALPANNTLYLWLAIVNRACLADAYKFLKSFRSPPKDNDADGKEDNSWPCKSFVLIYENEPLNNVERDKLVNYFARGASEWLGRLKIAQNDFNLAARLIETWCTEQDENEFSFSQTKTGYWHKFPPGKPVWLCNFEGSSDGGREKLFLETLKDKPILNYDQDLSGLRYGLINSHLPKDFRALFFVHYTQWRKEMLANDIKSMDDATRRRFCFCLYSGGGGHDESLEDVRKVLGNRAFQCRMIYDCVKRSTKEIRQVYDAFIKDVEQNDASWFSFSALEKSHSSSNGIADSLPSFTILLQGTLAVFRPELVFGGEENSIEVAQKFMEENGIRTFEKAPKQLAPDRLFRPHGMTINFPSCVEYKEPACSSDEGWYWFDEGLPDVEKIELDQLKTQDDIKDCTNLFLLIKIIQGITFEKNDWTIDKLKGKYPSQGDLIELLAHAHLEYLSLFDGEKKKIEDFERKRNALNHNEVKNAFLNMIGTARDDLSVTEKSRKIHVVWADKRGEKVDPGELEETLSSGQKALDYWPNLRQNLQSFFEVTIPEYGYQLTEKGRKLFDQIFHENFGCVPIIDSFVTDFWQTAMAPETVREKRLTEFWQAGSCLHQLLSRMAQQRGNKSIFNGYLELIDDANK